MRLYFEIGDVIKTNDSPCCPRVECQKKGSLQCMDCSFYESDEICDGVACEGGERFDGEDVIFREVNEVKGGEK